MVAKEEKRIFIHELIETVKKTVLENVDKMPEEWDGFELREYIAYKFKEAAFYKMPTKRTKAYKNAILVNNL